MRTHQEGKNTLGEFIAIMVIMATKPMLFF